MYFKLSTLFELTFVAAVLLFPFPLAGENCFLVEFFVLNVFNVLGVFLFAIYANVYGKNEAGRLLVPSPRWLAVAKRFWAYSVAISVAGWIGVFSVGAIIFL